MPVKRLRDVYGMTSHHPDYDYRNKWLGAGASKTDGYDIHDLTSEDFSLVDARAYNEFYSDRVGGFIR